MPVPEPPLCAAPDLSPVAGQFAMPRGACDCHAHVFTSDSDLVATRLYNPQPSPLAQYRTMLDTLRIDRAVIVQPSVYGVDNRATLNATATAPDRFRAVVVLDEAATPRDLRKMHDLGARGARVNALYTGGYRGDLKRLGGLLADQGWHMQMLVDVSRFDALGDLVRALPVPVVFDHMGYVSSVKGTAEPGFQTLLRLMAEGLAWAKLSGSYHLTALAQPPYADVAPFARALVAANPGHCLWASDWPHPNIPIAMPNDGALLSMLEDWAPDRATRDRILVDNPAALYGFGS